MNNGHLLCSNGPSLCICIYLLLYFYTHEQFLKVFFFVWFPTFDQSFDWFNGTNGVDIRTVTVATATTYLNTVSTAYITDSDSVSCIGKSVQYFIDFIPNRYRF